MPGDQVPEVTHKQVSMEEADLLKERLQAITDKRRVQEDIAKKRRLVEEEKLKLQYIKKKSLREQWLMDGLSQQTDEEQEAMRLQAHDEQQQSAQLQSNIDRMEKEVEELETQELNISANEEIILKRLKEVERTAEDIIKDLNAGFNEDLISQIPWTMSESMLNLSPSPRTKPPKQEAEGEEPKMATFAMEISVEHDARTGESQVVATATVTPESAQERGVKIYDDGRKTVYALHHASKMMEPDQREEMTPVEVEELLRQAVDKKVPSEVQYHQPVYSTSYNGDSRPSTPRTPSRTPRQTPTPSHSPFSCRPLFQSRAQSLGEESCLSGELGGSKSPCSPGPSQMSKDGAQMWAEDTTQPLVHIPNQAHGNKHPDLWRRSPIFGAKTPPSHTNTTVPKPATLVSVKARSEGIPIPIQPLYMCDDGPLTKGYPSEVCQTPVPLIEETVNNRRSPYYPESEASLNFINALTEEFQTEPVTMVFMGYMNAEDEEEEVDFQAELVIINSSDEDKGKSECNSDEDDDGNGCLSYHPEGYKSKVFSPRMGVAKVSGSMDLTDDLYTNCDDLLPLKPTFVHKPGKTSPCLDTHLVPTWKR